MNEVPEFPPMRQVSETGKEWKQAFGRFWSPKDWRRLQRLGLMQLDRKLKGYQVEEILFEHRSVVEDAIGRALMIGLIVGLLFGAFVL